MAISSLQTPQEATVFCSTNLKLIKSPLENENNVPSPSKATLESFVEEAKVQCSLKSTGKHNHDEDSLPHAKRSKICGQAYRMADKQETCELLSRNDFIICVATSYPTSPSTSTTNAIHRIQERSKPLEKNDDISLPQPRYLGAKLQMGNG